MFQNRKASAVVAALSLGLASGCEQSAPPPPSQPTPQKAPTPLTPTGEISQTKGNVTQFTLEYDLPLQCPPGAEFIKAADQNRFSPEQLIIINSAHYLWRTAVGTEGDRRAKLAAMIPVAPSPSDMPPDHPFFGAIRATIAPMELKAAYVAGEVTIEEIATKKTQTQPFRLFTFAGISASDSFFTTVGSLGHEFEHAVQGDGDLSNPLRRSPQETFRRELGAYSREVQDLLLVSDFLRKSPEIDPVTREKNLNAWLTDIAGAIHHAGYYSFRFKLQYFASSVSSGLSGIEKHLTSGGANSEVSTAIHGFQYTLAPLMEYQRSIIIDSAAIRGSVVGIRAFVTSQPLLLDQAAPDIRKRSEVFLDTVRQLGESVTEVEQAERRLSEWKASPKPLE